MYVINEYDTNKKNKIIGSLIGGAVGDALGYPIEFKKVLKKKNIQNIIIIKVLFQMIHK